MNATAHLVRDEAPVDRRLLRGAASRSRIVDAALTILGEGGYGALSISAICRRAGVSPTSLYHHFGDKAGLLSAMVDEVFTRNERVYLSAMEGLESPLEQLDAFMASVRDVLADDTRNSGAIFAALSQARGDAEDMARVIGAARRRVWQQMATRFSEYMQIENGMALTHIFSAFSAYIPQVRHDPDSAGDVEAMLQTLRNIVLVIGGVIQPKMMEDAAYAAAVATARTELTRASATDQVPGKDISPMENHNDNAY